MKTILFVCYWFPPINIIGALRPYQQAKFLADNGYRVIVVCAYFPKEDKVICVEESKNLKVIRYDDNKLSSLLLPNLRGVIDNLLVRGIKFALREMFFPDQFVLNKRKILELVDDVIKKEGKPSLIISSALPFSMHTIACQISKKYQINWIADHRDLWAQSPYRKRLTFLRKLDVIYERKILSQTSYNIVIGEKMRQELELTLQQKNIAVVRNGADVITVNNQAVLTKHEIIFSYTGILYGGFRDPSALFDAILLDDNLRKMSSFNFYGSEKNIVSQYQENYKDLFISYYGRKDKTEIKEIQNQSHFLVIALGNTFFEKSVLTGKFYEYLETGRAIIALCDEDSELAILINKYQVGVATRDTSKILKFIKSHQDNNFPLLDLPKELTRTYQNQVLFNYVEELSK